MADHDDHIHVGFRPQYGSNSKLSKQLNAVLKPEPVVAPDRPPGQDREPEGSVAPSKCGAEGQAVAQGPVTDDRRFRFVQWEFAGRLGPPPGRYVVRRYAGDVVREVVVVTEGSAPRRPAPPRTARRGRR